MSSMTEKMSKAGGSMTEKMSKAGSGQAPTAHADAAAPKKGDRFRCAKCGMEVKVTADCKCADSDHAHFHCCGEELQKV